METNSKRNEHPACSCWACRAGKRTPAGHATAKATQRKLRRMSKLLLKRGDDPTVIVGTPYTD
jgi:hypothetical protein